MERAANCVVEMVEFVDRLIGRPSSVPQRIPKQNDVIAWMESSLVSRMVFRCFGIKTHQLKAGRDIVNECAFPFVAHNLVLGVLAEFDVIHLLELVLALQIFQGPQAGWLMRIGGKKQFPRSIRFHVQEFCVAVAAVPFVCDLCKHKM